MTSEMFTFLDMLAMVVPESSFGACVCLKRPEWLNSDERSCKLQVLKNVHMIFLNASLFLRRSLSHNRLFRLWSGIFNGLPKLESL